MTEEAPQQSSMQLDRPKLAEIVENVIIKGGLSQLNPQQRSDYYMRVCQSIGINALTKPFDYLELKDGKGGKKLVLYARRDCTDQLRSIRGVSVRIVGREHSGDLYIVTARASMLDGREDESLGAVSTATLAGEDLANALMKAETKAKRRVTLSICGLGLLDETEVEPVEGGVPYAMSSEPPVSNPTIEPARATVRDAEAEENETFMVTGLRLGKSGTNGSGPWQVYRIKFDDGVERSTFHKSAYEAAETARRHGKRVRYAGSMGKYGYEISRLEIVE